MEKITICSMGRVFQVEAKDKKDGLILAADMAQAMSDIQEIEKDDKEYAAKGYSEVPDREDVEEE